MATTAGGMIRKVIGASSGAAISNVLNVGGSMLTFSDSRKQGDNMAVSVAKTGADFAFGELMSGFGLKGMLAYMAITTGYDMTVGMGIENGKAQARMASTGSGRVGSGYFNMSNAGYTMRQRAISQIRTNGQNVNSVLGNEARNYLKSAKTYT